MQQNIVEREGFIHTFGKLCQELNVKDICTDAHAQISAILSEYLFTYIFTHIVLLLLYKSYIIRHNLFTFNMTYAGGSSKGGHHSPPVE